ncbi:fibrillin-1-like [Ahaetulla prasina]|uniref:fibrillin-1-like n=1 Tax=Ahaetulla prasina TaxID=499056 RepID=UPI0026482B1F|nr:fibrillin-1-like [Ahaetulla prasina]
MRLGRLLVTVAWGFSGLLLASPSPGDGIAAAGEGSLRAAEGAAASFASAAKETNSRASRAKRRGQAGGAAGHDALKGPNVCGSRYNAYCCPGWKTLPGGNQCITSQMFPAIPFFHKDFKEIADEMEEQLH